jgi:hypothetical protein
MPYFEFFWNDAIIAHLAEHGVTPDDFEQVVTNPDEIKVSRSSGLPAAVGYTRDGRKLFCVYQPLDELYLEPVTAFEIED